MSKQSVSLCMIVKNESKTIKRTLNSVDKFVDEYIIAIDDSVSDGTDMLIKNWFKKRKKKGDVFFFKWDDNFSKARNLTIRKATKDWVIILDGHEYFDEKTKPMLNKMFDNLLSTMDFLYLNMLNRETGTIIAQLRLFKNNIGVHYKGRVHNEIVGHTLEKSTLMQGITLLHDRYKPDIVLRAGQREDMIITHMKKKLESEPNNLRSLFYLTRQYIMLKEYKKSIEYGKRYLEIIKDPLARAIAMGNIAVCYMHLRDITNGIKYINETISADDTYPYGHLLASNYHAQRKEFDLAEECIVKAMKRNKIPSSFIPIPISFYTWFPFLTMAQVKLDKKEFDEAQKALDIVRTFSEYFCGGEEDKIITLENAVIEGRKNKDRKINTLSTNNFRMNTWSAVV